MITLTHLELEKVKKEGMEVFTQEQYNRFLEANMEVLQKGESNTLDELEKAEYEELKEEIKSFAEALVYSPSKESEFRIEKSICYIRPKQVEWDESELIKGEDGEEIEKARAGKYTDTPLNRKLGRVGQQYGGEKKEGGLSHNQKKTGFNSANEHKGYINSLNEDYKSGLSDFNRHLNESDKKYLRGEEHYPESLKKQEKEIEEEKKLYKQHWGKDFDSKESTEKKESK